MPDDLRHYFVEQSPEEAAALQLKSGESIFCSNQADEFLARAKTADQPIRNVSFVVPHDAYRKHHANIAAIHHSHVLNEADCHNGPSVTDQLHQHATNVPWVIWVVLDGAVFDVYSFRHKAVVEPDQCWRPGIQDEFTPVEQWHNIRLPLREGDFAVREFAQRMVLSGSFSHQQTDILKSGDVLVYEDGKVSLWDGVQYQTRTRRGSYSCSKQPHNSKLFLHLRKE